MKLSKDEIALLRSLVEWRRANGWTLERDDFTYISPDRKTEFWPGWGSELGDRMFIGYPQPEPGKPRERVIPPCLSVREAVDVLVVFGLLPVEFSSAWAAGRESAYTTDEWRITYGPANKEHAAEYHIPLLYGGYESRQDADEDLVECRREVDPAAQLEHRRTGATDWEKVSDADS